MTSRVCLSIPAALVVRDPGTTDDSALGHRTGHRDPLMTSVDAGVSAPAPVFRFFSRSLFYFLSSYA